MEYTIKKLSQLAGISSRTLRYYDEIGLLKPSRINSSGYRIYSGNEVDALQQIMFYRELCFELSEIKIIIQSPSFNRLNALKSHLSNLENQKEQLDLLIDNLNKTIQKEEGRLTMNDKEKFEGFKKNLIDKNEKLYGDEIRQKYGDESINQSNEKFLNLTQDEFDKMQKLSDDIQSKLEYAVKNGEDAKGDLGQEIAQMHKDWLSYTWQKYNEQAHAGLANMYVEDERFTEHYDKDVKGCAVFLKNAILYFLNK